MPKTTGGPTQTTNPVSKPVPVVPSSVSQTDKTTIPTSQTVPPPKLANGIGSQRTQSASTLGGTVAGSKAVESNKVGRSSSDGTVGQGVSPAPGGGDSSPNAGPSKATEDTTARLNKGKTPERADKDETLGLSSMKRKRSRTPLFMDPDSEEEQEQEEEQEREQSGVSGKRTEKMRRIESNGTSPEVSASQRRQQGSAVIDMTSCECDRRTMVMKEKMIG